MIVQVYNITYNTITALDNIDHREEALAAGEIPSAINLKVLKRHYQEFNENPDDTILKCIEGDWIIDSFDYKLPTGETRHVTSDCYIRPGVTYFEAFLNGEWGSQAEKVAAA